MFPALGLTVFARLFSDQSSKQRVGLLNPQYPPPIHIEEAKPVAARAISAMNVAFAEAVQRQKKLESGKAKIERELADLHHLISTVEPALTALALADVERAIERAISDAKTVDPDWATDTDPSNSGNMEVDK